MTSRNARQPAAKAGNDPAPKQPDTKSPPYISRYVAVDSHLAERKGSSDSVSSLTGERPAGRKLAQDIANACNQLYHDGYEVISIFPMVAGRVVEAYLEVDEDEPLWKDPSRLRQSQPTEEQYESMTAGYSVTDGVIITAKRPG